MTNRDWAVLGFRLVGFYLATGLAMLVAGLLFRQVVGGRDIAEAVAYAVMLAAVWAWADRLASWVFPEESNADLPLEGGLGRQLLVPALSIIGVYLIAEAIPSIVACVGVLVGTGGLGRSVFGGTNPSEDILTYRSIQKANTVAAVVRLVIGIVLLLYPSRITAAVVALRRDRDLSDSSRDEKHEPDGEEGQTGEDDRT